MSNAPMNYINLRLKRDFSDVISTAFQFVRQNWKSLYRPLIFICLPIYMVSSLFMGRFFRTSIGAPDLAGMGSMMLGYLFSVVAMLLLYVMVYEYMAFYLETAGGAPTTAQVWQRTRRRLLDYFVVGLVCSILITIGMFLVLIPGIWLAIVFSMAFPILAFRQVGLGDAFGQSFRLVKGRWWLTFGLILVVAVLIGFISYIIYLPFMLLVGFGSMSSMNAMNDPSHFGWMMSIFTAAAGVVAVLLHPFMIVTIGVHALSLMEEKDGSGLLERVESATAPDAD